MAQALAPTALHFGLERENPVQHAFRQTRGGRAFSPWSSEVGMPLHAPRDFSLQDHSARAAQRFETLLEAMEDSAIAPVSPPPTEAPATGAPDDDPGRPSRAPLSTCATNAPMASPPKSTPSRAMSKDEFHGKRRSKQRRALARERAAKDSAAIMHKVKAVALKRRARAKAILLETLRGAPGPEASRTPVSFADSRVPVSESGYVARRLKATASDSRPVRVEELVEEGFERVAWDGCTPRPLVDCDGTVFAVLAGRPNDAGWDNLVRSAASQLNNARVAYGACDADATHRRGAYPCITTGISYGGGQTYPRNFVNTDRVQHIAHELKESWCIKRIAKFGSSALRLFAPRLHGYYQRTLDGLCARDKRLTPLFPGSAFAACTFNLGPQTVTYVHTDSFNLPWGWCAVTALGEFDPKKGGHIVLWDLRMVIEFPPGATILIPSAVLRHSNTQVQVGETRLSFTQYSAGGLFRWVDCGYRSKKDHDRIHGGKGCQPWGDRGLDMLSKLSEFAQDDQ